MSRTTFRLFGLPVLRRLQAAVHARPHWPLAEARFEWARKNPKCLFLPGRLRAGAVERVPYTGSGDLLAYARANCQIVLPVSLQTVRRGVHVPVWPL